MAEPVLDDGGENIRKVSVPWAVSGGQAYFPVPVVYTFQYNGAMGNETIPYEVAFPFEEGYIAAITIGNSGAGTSDCLLSILGGSAANVLDDDANGTAATVDVAGALTTAKEYSVANGKVLDAGATPENQLLRGADLVISMVGNSGGTTAVNDLIITVTVMVPLQVSDETTPGTNFAFA